MTKTLRKTGERVWHTLCSNGVTLGYFVTDLVYVGDVPTLVLEWTGDQPEPGATVPLDPQYLHEVNWPQAKWMYEFAVDDPRTTSRTVQ